MIRFLLVLTMAFTAMSVAPMPAEAGFGSKISKEWKRFRKRVTAEYHRTDDNLKKFRDKLFNYKSECERKDDKARAAKKAYSDAVNFQEQMRDLVTIDKSNYQTRYFQKQQLRSQKRYLSEKEQFLDDRYQKLRCFEDNSNRDVCRNDIIPDRNRTKALLPKVNALYDRVPNFDEYKDERNFPRQLQESTRKFAKAAANVTAASNSLIYTSIDANYCSQKQAGQAPGRRECRRLGWDEDSISAVWAAQESLEEAKGDQADLEGELREAEIKLSQIRDHLAETEPSWTYYQNRYRDLRCFEDNSNRDVCRKDINPPKENTDQRMSRLQDMEIDLLEQVDFVRNEIRIAQGWWNRTKNSMAVNQRTEDFLRARNDHVDTRVDINRCEDVGHL